MTKVSNAVSDAERIAALRSRCFDRKNQDMAPMRLAWYGALKAVEGEPSLTIRHGLRTRNVLSGCRFLVDDLELLAGRLDLSQTMSPTERSEAEQCMAEFAVPGQTGHCELDLSELFEVGIDGIRLRLEQLKQGSAGELADTYQAFVYALDGLSAFIANAAAAAREAIPGALKWRAEELVAMAESCERIAHLPPKSFRDGVQLVWLVNQAVMYGCEVYLVGPGHIDRILYPLYAADMEAGALSRDDALVMLECLYLLINEFVVDGVAIAAMVGGRDADGNDVTNDLSYLALEAIRRTGLIYPTVGICWHEGTPDALSDLAIELIAEGYSTPAMFGDAVIQKGMKSLGVPAAEACNYINSTCVEITPCGASNVWVASPYYPLCAYLLDEIAERAETGNQPGDFAEFVAAYQKRLADAISAATVGINENRKARQQRGRKPLQSVFTRDCIARGKDIDDGGAVYNWVECSFVGLGNLADSLHVIREEVFRQKAMTFAQLHEVLTSNFENAEEVRQRFLNTYPKYGVGCDEVDAFVADTVQFFSAECGKAKLYPDDSPYVPGAFCWIMHEILGRDTGATPDGRKAGLPFADGAGPAQGRETQGPTAAILSTTSWDHSSMIGGVAFNMKFSSSLFKDAGATGRLRDLVLTYLRRGGFETQVNVVDVDTLKQAQANPDQYRDLVVRIGGYCDYFTRLSPEMQAEVMLRTHYTDL